MIITNNVSIDQFHHYYYYHHFVYSIKEQLSTMNVTTVVVPMKYLQLNDNVYAKITGDNDDHGDGHGDGVSINVEIDRGELERAISSFVDTFEETG